MVIVIIFKDFGIFIYLIKLKFPAFLGNGFIINEFYFFILFYYLNS